MGHSRNKHRTDARYRRHRRRIRRRQILASVVVCVFALLILGGIAWNFLKKQESAQISYSSSYDVGSGYRDITYNGKNYRYNNRITLILYAGIDSEGTMESTVQYGNKARADSIALVIMNEKTEKMSILPINRDTMTDIRRYTLNGNDKGLYTSHIGYAYSYGDGGTASCENLCEAVSLLLGGIPVKRYVVTNQDSMSYINNLMDGVAVTVPNDDLADQYPELKKGAVVTLDDTNIRSFLQYRDTSTDFSNEGRMERQKAYATAYINKAKTMKEAELEELWDSLDSLDGHLQTNIKKNQYIDLVSTFYSVDFAEDNYLQIPGEDQTGELHDEFRVDTEALKQMIVDLFYLEV